MLENVLLASSSAASGYVCVCCGHLVVCCPARSLCSGCVCNPGPLLRKDSLHHGTYTAHLLEMGWCHMYDRRLRKHVVRFFWRLAPERACQRASRVAGLEVTDKDQRRTACVHVHKLSFFVAVAPLYLGIRVLVSACVYICVCCVRIDACIVAHCPTQRGTSRSQCSSRVGLQRRSTSRSLRTQRATAWDRGWGRHCMGAEGKWSRNPWASEDEPLPD